MRPTPTTSATPRPRPMPNRAEPADDELGRACRTSRTSWPSPSTSDDSVQSPEPPDDARLVVGKSPGVTAEDHVAEAGRKVLRFHLARMLAREAGTREGIDPEELHAMRVATRRQRAAWRVFGASFRPGRTKRYRNGLREIAVPARDRPRPRRPARGRRRATARTCRPPKARPSNRCCATGAGTATTLACC